MNWFRFVVAAEIRKILAFRADFWITFVGQTAIQVLIARALWGSIFKSTGNEVMEGYTLETMTLYFLIVPIGSKMLAGENIGFLSREIYEGTFSKYLLYPISFFQYKTLTYLTHSFFYGFQLMLVYLSYLIIQFQMITLNDLIHLGTGLSIFFIAAWVYCMLAFCIEMISLWADNIWSLMVMTRFLFFFFGGAFIPVQFFPEWLQKNLTYTPFPYLLNLPARTVMGKTTPDEIMWGLTVLVVWGGIFALMGRLVWSRGQFRYSGVGI